MVFSEWAWRSLAERTAEVEKLRLVQEQRVMRLFDAQGGSRYKKLA
jgi:tryptophanase